MGILVLVVGVVPELGNVLKRNLKFPTIELYKIVYFLPWISFLGLAMREFQFQDPRVT